jgi:hypothetical protein
MVNMIAWAPLHLGPAVAASKFPTATSSSNTGLHHLILLPVEIVQVFR